MNDETRERIRAKRDELQAYAESDLPGSELAAEVLRLAQ